MTPPGIETITHLAAAARCVDLRTPAADLVQGDARRRRRRSATPPTPPIGMAARVSQVSRTNRDSPSPSLPTTSTSGPDDSATAEMSVVGPPSSPTRVSPASAYARSVRLRLVARAIGIRAAAPAEVFQAAAVIPAERRSGISTPWAPKAAAERTIAPRLRGSVIESRATISGGVSDSIAAASRSSGWAYSNVGSCRATPWCTAPPVSRSSSTRVTSSRAMLRSAASLRMSRSRSSRSAPSATYAVLVGISASSASSTALRPTTHSGPVPGVPVRGPPGRCAVRGPAVGGPLGPVRRVVRPVLRLRGRAASLQPAADPPAGAGGVALAALRTAPLRWLLPGMPRLTCSVVLVRAVSGSARDQRGPAGVSESRCPGRARASRIGVGGGEVACRRPGRLPAAPAAR